MIEQKTEKQLIEDAITALSNAINDYLWDNTGKKDEDCKHLDLINKVAAAKQALVIRYNEL